MRATNAFISPNVQQLLKCSLKRRVLFIIVIRHTDAGPICIHLIACTEMILCNFRGMQINKSISCKAVWPMAYAICTCVMAISLTGGRMEAVRATTFSVLTAATAMLSLIHENAHTHLRRRRTLTQAVDGKYSCIYVTSECVYCALIEFTCSLAQAVLTSCILHVQNSITYFYFYGKR